LYPETTTYNSVVYRFKILQNFKIRKKLWMFTVIGKLKIWKDLRRRCSYKYKRMNKNIGSVIL